MNILKMLLATATLVLPSVSGHVMANDADTLYQAKKCTEINARLERLNCFDQVFNTSAPQLSKSNLQTIKPETWSRGYELEKQRAEFNQSPLLSKSSQNSKDIWLTLPSTNTSGKSAILMLSCIDNISRIDILLNVKINEARVDVSTNSFVSNLWKTDDSGFVLSSPRGIPAISLMKKISKQPILQFHTSNEIVNGLQFNTSELSKSFIPLRKSCQW